MTLFFPRVSCGVQRLFCTCVHARKTQRPQEVPFLLCGHLKSHQVIGEGQEKMVHPSRISKYYSPSLLPCQDRLYLYFSLQFCVCTWVFFLSFKNNYCLFYSVSEQRYEIFLLLVYWVKGSKHSIAMYVLSTTVQRRIWPTDCESSWEEAQRFSKPQNHMLKIIVWKVIVPQNGLIACQVSCFPKSFLNSWNTPIQIRFSKMSAHEMKSFTWGFPLPFLLGQPERIGGANLHFRSQFVFTLSTDTRWKP